MKFIFNLNMVIKPYIDLKLKAETFIIFLLTLSLLKVIKYIKNGTYKSHSGRKINFHKSVVEEK